MFAFQYLRDHRKIILMELVFICIFAVMFRLYHLPLAAVLYPAGLCFVTGSIFAGCSAYQAYKKHRRLEAVQVFHGDIPASLFDENGTVEERDYRRILEGLNQELRDLEERSAGSYEEMIDYFTVWVHQIKTPIASMRLHLAAEDTALSRKLKSDLLHIEQYVEMVLTYFKMGSDTTDYVFRTVSLDSILRENIRKLRGDFIMKKLRLEYEPIRETVVSDEKWLSFVIEQLLSNALKYTHEGFVTIFLEEPKTLCIRDTGIGIAPEDIPRIFEKGYTGGNGRRDKRASGLGLYLCRQICSRLGAEISITSQVEKGTTVRIDLSQKSHLNE